MYTSINQKYGSLFTIYKDSLLYVLLSNQNFSHYH